MQIITGPTFAAGTAISNVLSIGVADPLLIITPPEWTSPANLLCLYSPDSTNFYPLWQNGRLWEVICPPNAAIVLQNRMWPKGSYIRFISGFVGNPINQGEERIFKIIAD
jgi:hypothetical protein